MRKYLFQRFLPNCDTNQINLVKLYTNYDKNMKIISVSWLDEKIDTEEDLDVFLTQYEHIDILLLNDDRKAFSNIILNEYAIKTLKSYIYWITRKGFNCYWTRQL